MRVTQLIPAGQGWKAVRSTGSGEQRETTSHPVIAWGLCEDGLVRAVVAPTRARTAEGFAGGYEIEAVVADASQGFERLDWS